MGRLTLCLDSATLIDLIRGRSPDVRDNYRRAVQSGADFAVPAVVMHELFSGMAISRNPSVERERMEETLVGLPVIDLTGEDAEATGRVAADLRRRGRPIGDIDTLIAGQALARGWTVVTRNVKHFGRIEGLPLIDWSVGPGPLSEDEIAACVASEG
ncbi:MAG: type II toxin-antitoxin system VapC family toxin [Alphaproteobacteria bacterium]